MQFPLYRKYISPVFSEMLTQNLPHQAVNHDYRYQAMQNHVLMKWQDALMDIYKLYQRDPRAMQERVEALIEEYFDTFWYLDGLQQQQFAKDFCAITDEQWRWPTESEINQLKEAMRYELMQELKPVFAEVQRTILEEMKKSLQKETDDLVLYLNQEISFEVRDPDAEEPGLRNSRVEIGRASCRERV